MNDNSSKGKMSFVYLHSVNVKGNWAHFVEENSQSGAQITTNLGYHENVLVALPKKHFENICFALIIKIMLFYLKFHFKI